ncbi:lysyl oxidase homolog 4-like isoform X1 [Branchiostoma lanceolatum]
MCGSAGGAVRRAMEAVVRERVLWALLVLLVSTVVGEELETVEIRLRGGSDDNEGRVEVLYNGEYGTICDDEWNINAANVVCRQLGYKGAVGFKRSSFFGPGTGQVWLDNVVCKGNETKIDECSHRGWGKNDCNHDEDSGVICSSEVRDDIDISDRYVSQVTLKVGDIRLRGLTKRIPQAEGYVEINYQEKWWPICADGWDYNDAKVVCGQLGFRDALTVDLRKYRYERPLLHKDAWLTRVDCTGAESTLTECRLERLIQGTVSLPCLSNMTAVVKCDLGPRYSGVSPTTHRKLSAITTQPQFVRLKGGANTGEGRVEIYYNRQWGTVCGQSWDVKQASVVCRELGYGSARSAPKGAQFGQGHGPVWLDHVVCTGNELSIVDCAHSNFSATSCTHDNDASVQCNVPDLKVKEKIRLSGGRNPREGRVEIQRGRKWGMVCSNSWTYKEAGVACRQLGMGYALHALKEVWYFEGDKLDFVMADLECDGTEEALHFCRYKSWTNKECRSHQVAGIICTQARLPDLVPDASQVRTSIYLEDRPLYLLYCAAEENCLASSAYQMEWPYGSRRLLRFTQAVANFGKADFRPNIDSSQWIWHQCHAHYHSMEIFTQYDLLSENGTKVAEGHKASFCLEDSHCYDGYEPKYDCNVGEQGISMGCDDTYKHSLDCQWIDITGVPSGTYTLEVIINPLRSVAEMDFENNRISCKINYNGYQVVANECHLGEDELLNSIY